MCRRSRLTFFQENESKSLRLQEEQYIPFNEQQKSHVTSIYNERKNKSIILHHVLPNSPENVFLRPLLLWWKNRFILLREKERKLFCLQEEQYIPFNEQQKWHVTNLYTVIKITELPNIQFSLTTVRDTSLQVLLGIQTCFIYSSRIIGKPQWISIEKCSVF